MVEGGSCCYREVKKGAGHQCSVLTGATKTTEGYSKKNGSSALIGRGAPYRPGLKEGASSKGEGRRCLYF